MIENLALRIATALKRMEPEKTASIAVMKYSLVGLLNTLLTILILCLIGIITGELLNTVIGFVGFAFLRFFSGGLHLRSAMQCSVVSTLLLSIAPHLPLTSLWIQLMGCVTIIILLIFAPSNIEGHARIPSRYFPHLKFVSVLIVSVNFLWMSGTLAIVFFLQALTTIRLKRR